MSDMEEILPDDSVSQVRSALLNFSSHIAPSANPLPIPQGVRVIDRCIIIENTLECLNKLIDHFQKVYFPKE